MSRAGYLLGVDGGGTHTRALLTNASGRVFGHGEAGTSNALAIGRRGAEAAIQLAVGQAIAGRQRVEAAVFGLAGVAGPEDQQTVRRLRHLFPFIRALALENDGTVALYAGTRGAPGILVNAGTGTVVVGRGADGRTHRADGWGYLMGDEGSAYDIGTMALRAAMRAYDGRGPRTSLYSAIMRHFRETSAVALMVRLSFLPPGEIRAHVADLARIAEREAKRGDRVAHSILRQAAAQLTRTALSVLRRIPEATDVLLTGGALAPGSLLRSWLRASLQAAIPSVSIRPLRIPSVIGAVLMACALAGANERRCLRSLAIWWKQTGRLGG